MFLDYFLDNMILQENTMPVYMFLENKRHRPTKIMG